MKNTKQHYIAKGQNNKTDQEKNNNKTDLVSSISVKQRSWKALKKKKRNTVFQNQYKNTQQSDTSFLMTTRFRLVKG